MVASAVEDTVNVLATIATVVIFLGMIPEFVLTVRKEKSNTSVNFYPLLALFGQCVSWLLYGWASESFFPVGAVNGLGAVMAIIFWFYFVKYEMHNPKKYIMLIGAVIIVMLSLTLYVTLGSQKKSTRADIIGYISCVGSVLLFGSPLMTMRRVIMTENSQIISIGLAVPGAINGALWTLYGILESDNFVLTPNCIACCLCLIQVVLIFVYPRCKIEDVDVESLGSNETKLLEEA